jgi:hypothetical protein
MMKAITALIVGLALLAAAPPPAPQDTGSAAVFALIDSNEWCPGGSVYLDLQTGSFLLYPRLARAACGNAKSHTPVEQGNLGLPALQHLRSAYFEARRTGLSRDQCELIVSNGGPKALVITAAGFSARTPEEDGCWTEAADALYNELFEVFGKQRQPAK